MGGGASTPREELSNFVVDYVDENRGNCCELGMHVLSSDDLRAQRPAFRGLSELVITVDGEADHGLLARKVDSNWTVIGFGKGTLGVSGTGEVRAELAAHAPDGTLSCSTDG